MISGLSRWMAAMGSLLTTSGSSDSMTTVSNMAIISVGSWLRVALLRSWIIFGSKDFMI